MTGFLNIDKREGVSSAYAVNRVKKLLHAPCGHMGTLDPLASGVLPVGIGNAARLFEYFLEKKKTYLARFRFGVTTKTLDRESEEEIGGRVPTRSEIEGALPSFLGEIDQIPPEFSAKFVDGKRSYELARQGKEVSLSPKRVSIERFSLLEQTAPDEFSFEIVCGGGTYIRSLARDLALALQTKGFMSALRRTRSGVFSEETAVPLEEFTPETVERFLIPTETVLPFPSLSIEDERYYHGVAIPTDKKDGVYKIYHEGSFYGTGEAKGGYLRPLKKLC